MARRRKCQKDYPNLQVRMELWTDIPKQESILNFPQQANRHVEDVLQHSVGLPFVLMRLVLQFHTTPKLDVNAKALSFRNANHSFLFRWTQWYYAHRIPIQSSAIRLDEMLSTIPVHFGTDLICRQMRNQSVYHCSWDSTHQKWYRLQFDAQKEKLWLDDRKLSRKYGEMQSMSENKSFSLLLGSQKMEMRGTFQDVFPAFFEKYQFNVESISEWMNYYY